MGDDGNADKDCGFSVQLELNLDCQPISGRLRPERGAVEPFVGWLGFVEALKRLHDAATTEERERSVTMDDWTQTREADRIE